jgi:hypothetical protein
MTELISACPYNSKASGLAITLVLSLKILALRSSFQLASLATFITEFNQNSESDSGWQSRD